MRTSRVVALALVVGTFFVTQEVLTEMANGGTTRLANDVEAILFFWMVWALLTPLVLSAVRRWPLEDRSTFRPILAHALVAIALASVEAMVAFGLRGATLYLSGELNASDLLHRKPSASAFVWSVFTGVFFYAVAVMLYSVVRYRRLYVAEQLSAVALKAELTGAKLDTLRSQLRPHFLFNTLNAISVFVTEDAEKAQKMILRLSTLLRRSLDEEAHVVPLHQELSFVNDYLDIQRARFGDGLNVNIHAGADVIDAPVPVFLLQPLLENAIEHGKSDGKPTTITLDIARDGDTLRITLADDGPGIDDDAAVREGIGLGNTRVRLRHLYGPQARIDIGAARGNGESRGARVEILIPFRGTGG